MKEQLGLSCKRINSRPSKINLKKLILTRILLHINISKFVANDLLFLNINETSFTKRIKTNYSWTPIGENGELLNSNDINSKNLVLAFCSNGSLIEMITNDTLNEERFIVFMQNVKKWFDENNRFSNKKIWILLDNLASHRTQKAADLCSMYDFKIWFIPPYSHTLAPVDLAFGILKIKLTS